MSRRPATLQPPDRPEDLPTAEWDATLIVASDDVATREALAGLLSRAGYRVIETADAAGAHDAVTRESADLLIADMVLPGDSLELCRAIKSEPLTSLVPVVHLAAESSVRQRHAALNAGSDDVIAGPLAADEVLMRIRSLLRARRASAQLVSTEAVMVALAKTVEARDLYTERHLFRVAEGAVRVATLLGLPHERVEVVRLGGLLHDLGKIGVPDRVLLKPGALTRPEFELVRSHPLTGAEIVRPLAAFGSPERIVLHHHERFDGTGYPFGLRGEDIPLGARIVAVSDAFDAITTNRPYRPARPAADALAILEDGRGSQWDPLVVDAFLGLYRDAGPGVAVMAPPDRLGVATG